MHCFGLNQISQCKSNCKKDLFSPNCDAYNGLSDGEDDIMKIVDIECGACHIVVKTGKNEYFSWGLNNVRQCLVFVDCCLSSVRSPTKFEKQKINSRKMRL